MRGSLTDLILKNPKNPDYIIASSQDVPLPIPSDGRVVTANLEIRYDISVSPNSYNFGGVKIGSKTQKTFTVQNTGTASFDINGVSIDERDASEFNISKENCSSKTLTSSKKCEIDVNFSPKTSGSKEATLKISSNIPNKNIISVALAGNGADKTFTLILKKQGTGFADVSGNIICPVNKILCNKVLSEGAQITIKVNTKNSRFIGWEGECKNLCDDKNSSCTFTINSNITCIIKTISIYGGDIDNNGDNDFGVEIDNGVIKEVNTKEIPLDVENEVINKFPNMNISNKYPRMVKIKAAVSNSNSVILRWHFDPPLPEDVKPYKYVNGKFYDLSDKLKDNRSLLELEIQDNGQFDANLNSGEIEDPLMFL